MLARGRADDTVEAISRRLAIYHRETTPLIDYYDDKVVHVDGVGTVDEVHERVLTAVQAALAGSPDAGDTGVRPE